MSIPRLAAQNANFENTNFNPPHQEQMAARNANFEHANFEKVNFENPIRRLAARNADFENANFEKANFQLFEVCVWDFEFLSLKSGFGEVRVSICGSPLMVSYGPI